MASIMRPTMLRRTCHSLLAKPSSLPRIPVVNAVRPPQVQTTAVLLPHRSPKAAFHASARRAILPPGPQVIDGTANDPAPVPPPSPTHGSYHWTFERALSVGLIPLTIAPFAAGSLNPALDAVLIATILLHSHLGFSSIITDYIPTWQYPTARKLFNWALKLATLVVGVGFYEFETNDVGLTEGIQRIWRAGSTKG